MQYALKSKDAIKEAQAFSQRKFGGPNIEEGNDRNRVNAFQHSYWNALLTLSMGAIRTKVWVDAHEWGLPNNPDNNFATQMDLFNNQIGRNIGDTWIGNPQGLGVTLVTLVENWIESGQMQHVCFDLFLPNNPTGFRYTNQRLAFTNQICR